MSYYTKTAASVETFLEQIRQRNTKSNKTKVYRCLKKNPHLTKNQMMAKTGMPHQTLTSRLSVLMDLGLVEVTGTKTTIGADGNVFESTFKVQTDENRIYINQIDRRNLRLKHNAEFQLKDAARALLHDDLFTREDNIPNGWNSTVWKKMCNKPYSDRLVVSGALIAAELDRLTYVTIESIAASELAKLDNLYESIKDDVNGNMGVNDVASGLLQKLMAVRDMCATSLTKDL